jgi:D-amino peptidase
MRIYILADMEGISGIRMPEQTQVGHPEYAAGRELMMQEMNVAISAAFDAGATEVVACDTHYGGGQVLVERMDPRACYETPNAGLMMPSLDESFAGVILLGHHARAGTLYGFMDHTMSPDSWFEYRINDVVVGEIGIEAAYAGHFGVPVIAVCGDGATAEEATALLAGVKCGVVKWGIGRNRAKCLSIPEAHERVRGAVIASVGNAMAFKAYQPSLPAVVQLTLYRSDMADALAAKPEVERVDARTVRKTVTSLLDVCKW